MKDVKCPYCGKEQDINHDDGYGYEEDGNYEQECSSCDKTFAFTTMISFHYNVNKSDYLNGGEHKWKPSCGYPPLWPDARYCEDCGLREQGEPCSQEERDRILNEKT